MEHSYRRANSSRSWFSRKQQRAQLIQMHIFVTEAQDNFEKLLIQVIDSGMSFQEAADALGTSKTTIYRQYQDAKRRMTAYEERIQRSPATVPDAEQSPGDRFVDETLDLDV